MELGSIIMQAIATVMLAFVGYRELRRAMKKEEVADIQQQMAMMQNLSDLQHQVKEQQDMLVAHIQRNGVHLTSNMIERLSQIESNIQHIREGGDVKDVASRECRKMVLNHETRITVLEKQDHK